MKSHFGTADPDPWPYAAVRIVLVATLLCTAGVAQSSPASNDPTVEALIRKINQLEANQKQMQEKIDRLTSGAAAAPAPAIVEVAPTPEVPVQSADAPHVLGPVQFQGFSDVDYGRAWFEKRPEGGLNGTPRSFTVGDFDLFTNTRISEHWSVLGELLITSDFSNEFSAEIDRLLLTYRHNDYFKISFGKYATALGYYNNAFHRAQYFQTAIGRPIMYSDEDNGGILPTHGIGVSATGKIPSGSLGLQWIAEIGNGRSASNPDVPVQNFVDENNGKSVNLAVYAKPEWLQGFQTGLSVYRDTMHPTGINAIGQTIFTAHIVYVGSKLEWLNEAALVRHALHGSNAVYRSTTSYTQLAWSFGKTKPYFRFDYQNVPERDPIFGFFGRQSGPSFGVMRHLSNYVALKIQYGRLQERIRPYSNDLTAQLAFAF